MGGEGRSSNANQGDASGTTRSFGSGPHKSGKKPPSKSSNGSNNVSSQKKMKEQRFAPKMPGKAHSVTCDQSKECTALQTQRTCDHGLDTADSLRQLKDQAPGVEPTRQMVKMTAEEAKDEAAKFLKTLEQQGCNLKCKEELRDHNERRKKCEENEPKACALTLGHCNKKMQARIK